MANKKKARPVAPGAGYLRLLTKLYGAKDTTAPEPVKAPTRKGGEHGR